MLQVQNISYKAGEKTLLHDISFRAETGQLIALLGPNGAGKSTLMKVISSELQPTKGMVHLHGKPLTSYSIQQLALERAVMTQNIYMSSEFEAEEVVLMGRYPHFNGSPQPADLQAVQQALQQTQLLPLRKRIYTTLSGGEQQRVQFSRVLAQAKSNNTQPRLLLLDEPLNNLDIRHQHQLLEVTTNFARQGNTVLAVLHDINLAALYADKILLLRDGSLQAIGAPQDVLREELLKECYDFPVRVERHPYHNCPVVYFGCPARGVESNHQNTTNLQESKTGV